MKMAILLRSIVAERLGIFAGVPVSLSYATSRTVRKTTKSCFYPRRSRFHFPGQLFHWLHIQPEITHGLVRNSLSRMRSTFDLGGLWHPIQRCEFQFGTQNGLITVVRRKRTA